MEATIMKKWMIILVAVLFSAVFLSPVSAQMKKTAQTGFQFLKIDMTPRMAAMGGAFNMIGDDATALFSNPAGIAWSDASIDFFAGQTLWIADIKYTSAGLIVNAGNIGTFGFSVQYVDYGDIEGTVVADNEQGYEDTGMLDVGGVALGVAYARQITQLFTVGGQIKYVAQHLGNNTLNDGSLVNNRISTLAYDFGTIFYPGFKSFRFGMSIRNFSEELTYQKESFQLPLTFTIGVAMDVLDFFGDHTDKFVVGIDMLHPRDYSERVHFGGEYTFRDMFFFRAGYKVNYDIEDFSAGIGFKTQYYGMDVRLDYSYSVTEIFSDVNRFSVGFSF